MAFTLQILHASDLEGGVDAIGNAPNFAAVIDALEAEAEAGGYATILLSAGDNYIPGPFFNASQFIGDQIFTDTYNALFADVLGDEQLSRVGDGRGFTDIAIMNILGFDASAVGNHEFDSGPDAFEGIIEEALDDNTVDDSFGESLADIEHFGALFPYLSANLDVSNDADLGNLYTTDILNSADFVTTPDSLLIGGGANPFKLAASTIVDAGDEQIGVVGATTQRVETISSTGNVVSETGTQDDMPALAANIQPDIDALIAAGLNKIVLVSHLQDSNLERELAELLSGVDVIISGGSDDIFANADDRLREGDDAAVDSYPFLATDADGNPVAVVSTAGEYSYVGRLVVEFDETGVIVPVSIDGAVSGPVATDEQGVLDVTGEADLATAIANSEKATLVNTLTTAVNDQVIASDGTVFGESSVFLDGRRETVRTEESNFGNLTADANLAAARTVDADVIVSLKNGGGIRAPIGEIDGTTGELLPTQSNPASGKDEGEISELDIQNALRFNNGLAIVDLSAEDLKVILEHAVASSGAGSTPGQFPQVGGLRFSFDPDGTAQVLDDGGNVTTPGTRVQSIALVGDDGAVRPIVSDGAVIDGAPESIKVVTLDFLAGGGDGYPFTELSASAPVDTGIGEQQALADFLAANFPAGGDAPFDVEETAPAADTRIQILSERPDNVVSAGDISDRDELGATLVRSFVGDSGDPDDNEGASEVVSHSDGKLYVTNGAADRIDIFTLDGAADQTPETIDLSGLDGYDGVQSVAAANGLIVAAVDSGLNEAGERVNGFAAIYDAATLELITTVEAGALPDMVTFTPDGTRALIANEGQFNAEDIEDDGLSADAPGSVTVIELADRDTITATTIGFTQELIDAADGVRLHPDADPVNDLEPEYISVTPDGTMAYVALQENNAFAVMDLATLEFTQLVSMGLVDHSNGADMDATDDTVIDIAPRNTLGLRMADAIVAFDVGGATYVATANEGDGRGDGIDDDGTAVAFGDEARVGDLLDAGLIDESVDTAGLDRLAVSTIDGDTDGDGDIDVLHSFGGRGFTIFDEGGNVVFNSGSELESIIADRAPERFNNDDGESVGSVDDDGDVIVQNRSDAKGPEPEAIEFGLVGNRPYLFVGAERDSGVFVYNMADPANPVFVSYIDGFATDNVSPETIDFIPASESATGNAQIAVSYEVSGSTAVYDLAVPADEAQVEEVYFVSVGRPSDTAGRDFWSEVFGTASIEFLAEAFDQSAEFNALIDGLTDADGLNVVTNNAFGRDATADEQAEFLPVIAESGYDQVFLSLVDQIDLA